MKEFGLHGFLGLCLFSFFLLFLVGFNFPQRGPQTKPEVSTQINLPADAFKGFYYVEPIVWGDTIYLAVVKRNILSANLMNTCDYVVYEDPEDFGPEVRDFIKSKRDWASIEGSISVLSKGHFDICRNLFEQPTVDDLCVSADLGIGMDGGVGGGGLQGVNIPNALTGMGDGERGAGRVGAPDMGQGLGQRLSGQGGGPGGDRPSVGELFNAGGGDGGAGSFLWNYDPCSNQNCATSGGSSQKGSSGLGSSISGFGRKTLMMEKGGGNGPSTSGTARGFAYDLKGGREFEVVFTWSVGTNSGDMHFFVQFQQMGGGGDFISGDCNVGSDPKCAQAASAMSGVANTPSPTPQQVGGAVNQLGPLSHQKKEQKLKALYKDRDEKCKKNPNGQECQEASKAARKADCENRGLSPQQCEEEKNQMCKEKGSESKPECKEAKEQEDKCKKNSDDPACKPGGGKYPACDVPGQAGCDGDFTAFIPIAKVKEFLESGGKKGLVINPLPEGSSTPPTPPGEVPMMDPLTPFTNPVPDEVAESTTLSSNSTPCGSQTQDILTGVGGGSKPTKGNLLNCPDGTLPGPQGCRPIVDDGRGGGGGCLPGQPDCPGPTN